MFKISEKDIDKSIHDILNLIQVLKSIEGYCKECNNKTKQCMAQVSLLHGCELRLLEIRQKILGSVEDNNNEI